MAADKHEQRLQARLRVKDLADSVQLLDRLALLEILGEREELAFRVAELEDERSGMRATEWGTCYRGSSAT